MNKRIFNRGIIILLISILLVQASGTLTANASGLESTLKATNVPTPKSPGGLTFDRTPTYKWTKVSNASAYKYELWTDTTLVYRKKTGASCGTLCARTPTTKLGYNDYKWRVKARVNGKWKPWSAFKTFAVNNPNVPELLWPGTTPDVTPTFTWTKAKSVRKYRLQLKRVDTDTLIYDEPFDPSCSGTTCTWTPAVPVPATGIEYKWRVRVRKKNGVWKPWSAWKNYINGNFDFNSTHDGWDTYGGTWVHEPDGSDLTYAGAGVDYSHNWSNISLNNPTPYSNVTFEVRMKRIGTLDNDTNRLIIRGEPTSVEPYDWTNGYAFQYSNWGGGAYSIYDIAASAYILPWTTPTADNPINPGDWNVLKVVASGDTFYFYINGTLVNDPSTTKNSSLSSGKVGIGFASNGAGNKLYIDWASISDTAQVPAADALMDMFVLPGITIPGGSSTHSPSLP